MQWPLAQLLVAAALLPSAALKFKQDDEPACKDRMRGGFSNNIMRHHCGADLSAFTNDLTESAVSCEAATTPFLQRSLANKMFSHCGAHCIFDFDFPDKIAYSWNANRSCYEETDGCNQFPKEREAAKKHKEELCEAELCTHFVTENSGSLMNRYCDGYVSQGEDRSPTAKGCDASYTGNIQKALANHMFSHCGAWCLFDYDDTETVSYAWDPARECWTNEGCQGHIELEGVLARRKTACEFTTTTTTSTSTSTSTTTTTTSTSTSTTTTSTSTSTTTTSTTTITTTTITTTSTITTTTTTSTLTTTSTTTTSTTTSTSTSTTSTSTQTTTTTTSTLTTTSTSTTTTSTITTTSTTSTSTITSTSTTTTSTTTSTTTTTTSTSTVTSTTTTTTSTTTTTTSTTTQTTTTTTSTITSTITTTTTQTTTSTTTTSTTTTVCAKRVVDFSIEIMEGICGDLSKYDLGYADAVSCEPATTPFLQRALANKMFSHCGSWCIFDYYQPDKISYQWDATKKCFKQSGSCAAKFPKEKEAAVARQKSFCEEELCVPVAPSLSNTVSKRYCETTSKNGEDRSENARGCHDSYTPYVQRSLANQMFSHCGAWCLYDFDQPDKVSYGWNDQEKCWNRGSGCQGQNEQKLAVERKSTFCEADLCIPVQKFLSKETILTHCPSTSKSGEDRSQNAQACDSANTHKVHKALANKMFKHCGAWCLFDLDNPEKVSWHWSSTDSCWEEGDTCDKHPEERAAAVERKKNFCKA